MRGNAKRPTAATTAGSSLSSIPRHVPGNIAIRLEHPGREFRLSVFSLSHVHGIHTYGVSTEYLVRERGERTQIQISPTKVASTDMTILPCSPSPLGAPKPKHTPATPGHPQGPFQRQNKIMGSPFLSPFCSRSSCQALS